MHYLKTSAERSHVETPAPDFNCGWSALELLNSWSLQVRPSPTGRALRLVGANEPGRPGADGSELRKRARAHMPRA